MIRADDLHINGYKIYQDSELFCFGTDAVLLAWFSGTKKFKLAVDLCSGNGIIPILLSVHSCARQITGIELSEAQCKLAEKSIIHNGLEKLITVINEDIRLIKDRHSELQTVFDLVTVNPPYMRRDSGFVSEGERGAARTELSCTLLDVTFAAKYLLKNGGRLCTVNKPDRLADMICLMRENGIEPKRLRLVSPSCGKTPMLFLLEGIKGAKSGMTTEPVIEIYDKDGEYTPILKEIYGYTDEK